MSIETVTYIGDLNSSNPAAGDPVDQGNEHVAIILKALRNSIKIGINSPSTSVSCFASVPYRYDRDSISASVVPPYPASLFKAGPYSFDTANTNIITPQLQTIYDGLGCSEAEWGSEIILPEDRAFNIGWWGSYYSDSITPTGDFTLRDQYENAISSIVTCRDTAIPSDNDPTYKHIFNSVSHRSHTAAMAELPRVFIPKIYLGSTPVVTDLILYITVELAHYDTD